MHVDSGITHVSYQLSHLTAAPDRRPGSPGNQAAVDLGARVLSHLGWSVTTPTFPMTAWEGGGGTLRSGTRHVPLHPSPYGTGVDTSGRLVVAATRAQLEQLAEQGTAAGQVLLVRGELTHVPLAPEGYPFYHVPEHDELRSLLRRCRPSALIAATGRSPETAGAVEPFALIEDGTWEIPVADVTTQVGLDLLDLAGAEVRVVLEARRWQTTASNVVARRGGPGPRVVVTAHLDTKPDTPGALDNAGGVVTVLQLAALLDDADPVELVLINGEDHFSAAGELDYLAAVDRDPDGLAGLRLAVNIDAAGWAGVPDAWSTYNLDPAATTAVGSVLTRPHLTPGPQWWQSDHAVFAQRGIPAVAVTSSDFTRLLAEVVHTRQDTPDRIDPEQLVRVAHALADLIRAPLPTPTQVARGD